SLVRAGTRGGHRAAMELGKPLGQCEAQAQPRVAVLGTGVCAPETIEHIGQQITGNARSSVLDLDVAIPADAANGDVRMTATRCELDGIAQQMPDNLLQAPRLSEHHAIASLERLAQGDALGGGVLLLQLYRGLYYFAQVRFFGIDANLAAGDRTEVHEVIHDVGQTTRVACDRLSAAAGLAVAQVAV